ncbi:RHS repeat protein, partial [Alcanivorax sp. JB21]|uniref:RHS repeat domain-containing protein n=1 Tax=Alcanivorax limicola TaxID=2874102 RepID=UPI001CBCA7B9
MARYSYQYDGNGNRTQQTEHNGFGEEITTYTYDAADRLQAVHYPDKAEAYTFDAAWNRVTETVTDL